MTGSVWVQNLHDGGQCACPYFLRIFRKSVQAKDDKKQTKIYCAWWTKLLSNGLWRDRQRIRGGHVHTFGREMAEMGVAEFFTAHVHSFGFPSAVALGGWLYCACPYFWFPSVVALGDWLYCAFPYFWFSSLVALGDWLYCACPYFRFRSVTAHEKDSSAHVQTFWLQSE